MLLNSLKVSGFKVFGTQVEFSMVPKTKNYQNLNENIINTLSKKNLKSALLYGGNNTGKSSLLDALLAFKTLVLKGSPDSFPFDIYKNFCYTENDIKLEVCFFDGEKDITYGVEFSDSTAIGEYLFEGDQLLFSRERDKTIEGSLVEKDVNFRNRIFDLPIDKLILTFINEYVLKPGTDVFDKVKRFFLKISFLNDFNKNLIMSKGIMDFASNPDKMKILNNLIFSTEIFLDKRELAEEKYVIENDYYNKHISKENYERMKTTKTGFDGLRMVSYYKNSDGESIARPSILFDSVGTNKFIVLSMAIIDALLDDAILLIDEIDSSLHYKLTRALAILMNSSANHASQFIMTTHDVKLLSPKIFRKDQLNFMVRDNDSVSIVSLDNFKANTKNDIRSDSNFEKMYIEEKIVELPDTNVSNIIEKLNELWQAKI